MSRLQDIVKDYDTIFLLTDMRKSMWIITMMARDLGKTPVNTALGLDGWLVTRHGVSRSASDHLGCYFYSHQEIHTLQDCKSSEHSDP